MTEITQEQMRDRLGNIDQIRDLLFGQQMRDYEREIEQGRQRLDKLESNFEDFQAEVRHQLTELEKSLTTAIHSAVDSWEKKLQYLNLTVHEQGNQWQQDLKFIEQKAAHDTTSLQKELGQKTTFLESELAQTRSKLSGEVQSLREQVFAALERELAELKDSKLSRSDLAEVLFELCLKVKGSEFGNAQEGGQAELLLPEYAPAGESQ
jgi:hypothetical protein